MKYETEIDACNTLIDYLVDSAPETARLLDDLNRLRGQIEEKQEEQA